MAAPEGEDGSPEEKLRVEFQTALQDTVQKYVTDGVPANIALQEVSRLVGDVLYRICHSNGWLGNAEQLGKLAAFVSRETSFAFKSICDANDMEPVSDEPPPKLH